MNLRPYQQRCVDELDSDRSSALLCAHTGLGKSFMLAEVARREVVRGGSVLWTAHRRELLSQAANTLHAVGLSPSDNVWLRSTQELLVTRGPPATLLIVDEAHHLASDEWSRIASEMYPEARLVGASATPERGDGRALSMFSRMVVGPSRREAIDMGVLVPADVLRPDRALGPNQLAQDPIRAYAASAMGTKAMLFAPTVALAKEYAERFRDELSLAAQPVWGEMHTTMREFVMGEFDRGGIRIITSVAALTEGVDVPDVQTIILARGFGTAGGYIQAVGRGARPAPGKTRFLVLDLRGVSHDHGEPDDERTYHLEGKAIRRAREGAEVHFCPVCSTPVSGTECENCHYSGAMKQRKPRVLGLPMERFARQRAASDEEKTAALASYMRRARAMGRQQWWAIKCWQGVHGTLPSSAMRKEATRLSHQKR